MRKQLTVFTIMILFIFTSPTISKCLAIPIYNTTTGHYYDIVSSGTKGWKKAEENAIALGGHLVTINDAAEETWLRDIFGKDTLYWIGFNDAAIEGTWEWSSGETPGYTNWDSGEPNNASAHKHGEDYAVLNWDTTSGAWNDWHRHRPDYYDISGIAEWGSSPVPEPATVALLGIGLVGLAGAEVRRRRKKKA